MDANRTIALDMYVLRLTKAYSIDFMLNLYSYTESIQFKQNLEQCPPT